MSEEATIGIREVYEAVMHIGQTLSEMNARLGAHIAQSDERARGVEQDLADHEGRIRSLERKSWALAGAAAAVGAAGGGGLSALIGG